ncbi:MAG TPA: hypothetical protein PK530_24455, partial [Anaerolineales bacterium]|nr:hypothetical protein [Anaerolineales bacterium]
MSRSTLTSVLFTLLLVGLLAAILRQNAVPVAAREPSGWETLLQTTPQPFLHPLPAPASGPFDGTYTKLVSAPPMWWKCFRCADYRVSGGIWKLQFDQGVMRLYYDATGWHSLASYTVSGDQVTLFNDPWCPDLEGHYTWQLTGDGLALTPVEDGCSFELRAANLSAQPWQACTADASIPGCAENPAPPAPVSASERAVDASTYSGDSRFYETPPDVTALANLPPAQTPEGVTITFHPASVSFGVSRVLWWEGNWIEVTTDRPFNAM